MRRKPTKYCASGPPAPSPDDGQEGPAGYLILFMAAFQTFGQVWENRSAKASKPWVAPPLNISFQSLNDGSCRSWNLSGSCCEIPVDQR